MPNEYFIRHTLDGTDKQKLERYLSMGGESKPLIDNGSLAIGYGDKYGDYIQALRVSPVLQPKMKKGEPIPDPERDAFARRVVDALNAANVLPPKQEGV